MGICDRLAQSTAENACTRTSSFSPRPFAAVLWILLAGALGDCSLEDGAGSILVDPGHYSAYHCNELATRWKALVTRENELRGLMEKAGEGSGGAVIGSLAYRSDYESVLTEEKLVQRTAAEKNCNFTPDYQSDHTIR
jgi:hypothetical protein